MHSITNHDGAGGPFLSHHSWTGTTVPHVSLQVNPIRTQVPVSRVTQQGAALTFRSYWVTLMTPSITRFYNV